MLKQSNGLPIDITSLEGTPELKKKIANLLTGLSAAGQAVGLGHVAATLADSRKRVKEANRALARAAGMEDIVDKEQGEDVHINIGDVHNQPVPVPQLQSQSSVNWPVILGVLGLLTLGGIGGTVLTLALAKPTAAILTPIIAKPIEESKEGTKQGIGNIKQGFLLELIQEGKK